MMHIITTFFGIAIVSSFPHLLSIHKMPVPHIKIIHISRIKNNRKYCALDNFLVKISSVQYQIYFFQKIFFHGVIRVCLQSDKSGVVPIP